MAPSAVAAPGLAETETGQAPFPVPRALATGEIADVVAQFRDAAANAMAAGFDGVELHAGNGFLIDQFLRQSSNRRRRDCYGGAIANRARLLLEIADAVSDLCGAARYGGDARGYTDFQTMTAAERAAAPPYSWPRAALAWAKW